MERNTICDKCGKEVSPGNDAVILDVLLGDWYAGIFAQSRHLLPTEDCQGSPSRAQYLEGQLKDIRGTYPYDNYWEKPIRDAYTLMQKEGIS